MYSRADKPLRLLKSWETAKSILSVKAVGVGKAFALELLGRISVLDGAKVSILPLEEEHWSFSLEIDISDAGFESVISRDSEIKEEREAAIEFGSSLTAVLRSGDEFFFRERLTAGKA